MRLRSRSKRARPYIWRLSILMRSVSFEVHTTLQQRHPVNEFSLLGKILKTGDKAAARWQQAGRTLSYAQRWQLRVRQEPGHVPDSGGQLVGAGYVQMFHDADRALLKPVLRAVGSFQAYPPLPNWTVEPSTVDLSLFALRAMLEGKLDASDLEIRIDRMPCAAGRHAPVISFRYYEHIWWLVLLRKRPTLLAYANMSESRWRGPELRRYDTDASTGQFLGSSAILLYALGVTDKPAKPKVPVVGINVEAHRYWPDIGIDEYSVETFGGQNPVLNEAGVQVIDPWRPSGPAIEGLRRPGLGPIRASDGYSIVPPACTGACAGCFRKRGLL